MTNISIKTYSEGEYTVLELSWFDDRLRRPQSVRAGMDRDRTEKLIAELRELLENYQ